MGATGTKPISTGAGVTVAVGAGSKPSATAQTALAARATTPEPKTASATDFADEKGTKVEGVFISFTVTAEATPTNCARPREP